MLEFALHEIRVGSRSYILLPKLNEAQMQALGIRLKRQGFEVASRRTLVARRRDMALRISPSGLCWSSSDPADSVVPGIPELLGCPKAAVPVEGLENGYFSLRLAGQGADLRFEPRMEAGSLWRSLRAVNQCGLSPDEHRVLLFLLEHAEGECDLLTDYPTLSGRKRVIGSKVYFESRLKTSEINATLRSVEGPSARNSYLPARGIIRLARYHPPPRREFVALFDDLGEWCYLRPI